jgi:hypothetical protein
MAFTLSHMVIAPPLYRLLKRKIPLASLAIGATVPDLPRLAHQSGDFSHSWSGLFSIDILIGLLVCLLWFSYFRPYCYALLARDMPQSELPARWVDCILLCAIGVLIGGATHLIWDGLTHDDFRSFAAESLLAMPIQLPITHWQMPLHRLLQYLSSILALPFLYYLIRPILRLPATCARPAVRFAHLGLVLSLALGFWQLIAHFQRLKFLFYSDTYFFYGNVFITFSLGFLLSFTLFALLYRRLFLPKL